jgi:hypothetical protein
MLKTIYFSVSVLWRGLLLVLVLVLCWRGI